MAFLLRIQHSSMQRTDSKAHQTSDVAKVFGTNAHVITFTEVGKAENPVGRAAVKAAASKGGWTLHMDPYNCGVAIKLDGAKVTGQGYEGPIVPGKSGDHPHLGLCWVTFTHPQLGTVTIGASHWLTRNDELARARTNDQMSLQIASFLGRKAAGSAIAFVTGDTNQDDRTHNPKPKGWTTIWDELGKHPGTLGSRTVDVIASYDPDKRVTGVGGRVLPLGLHSDHRTIMATYKVGPVPK